jgi:hypothetical protein
MDVVFGAGEGPPLEVVVLPPDAHDALFPVTDGVFLPGPEPLLVVKSLSDLSFVNGTVGATQVHELGHAFIARRIGRVPRWLDEGLAEWLETMSVEPEQITLGKIELPNLRAATSAGRVAFEGLESWEQLGVMNQAQTQEMYAAAWAWVAWLLSEEPDRFTRFLRAVQAGTPDAWSSAFDGRPPTEQTLTTFLRFGKVLMLRLSRQTMPRAAPSRHPASELEKYRVLARLALFDRNDKGHVGAAAMAKKGLTLAPDDRLLAALAGVQADGRYEYQEPRKQRPVVALAPTSNAACDDIEDSPALEGRTHLRPRTWIAQGEDPWPQSTQGESHEKQLELDGQRLEVLASSSLARTSIGVGLELEGNPRSPFVIVRRMASGGSCVVGAWRAEMLADAELRNLQTWVSKDKKLALVLIGFTVGKEKRWVVLGVSATRVWFALKSKGLTQAITSLAGFLPNAEGTVDVVFGNVDAWRLRGETLVQQPPAR